MILTTIALVAQASPAATATPAPAATAAPDPKVAATAKAWFVSLQHGKVLDASALTTQMAAVFTPAVLSSSETQLGPLGDPTSLTQVQYLVKDGTTSYVYKVGFKTGDTLLMLIQFDGSGKISGMRVLPPQ